MDWFLYDDGFRLEKVKFTVWRRTKIALTSHVCLKSYFPTYLQYSCTGFVISSEFISVKKFLLNIFTTSLKINEFMFQDWVSRLSLRLRLSFQITELSTIITGLISQYS